MHRLGCQGGPSLCPRLQQNTTLHFMSNDGTSDPVAWKPQLENNAWTAVTCALTQVCSGTLSVVTSPFTRSTNTLTQVTLPCAAAANELVLDSTNPSGFWTYTVNGAAPAYFTTTPLSSAFSFTLGTSLATGTEVTIANGDTVTVNTGTQVNLTEFSPTNVGSISTAISSVSNCSLVGGTAYRDAVLLNGSGQGINIVNVFSSKPVNVARDWSRTFLYWMNNDFAAGLIVNQSFSAILPTRMTVGVVGGTAGIQNAAGYGMITYGTNFDGDIILGNEGNATVTTFLLNEGALGSVFIDNGITVAAGRNTLITSGQLPATTHVWGTGTLNAMGRVTYPTGAAGAVGSLGAGGVTLQLNGQTKSCIAQPGAASSFGTCNVTISAANLDADLGATSGCLAVGGGASFCNYGP